MRMFLVGMCDIFLILYLTTLSQISPYRNSNITIDDYNRAKESQKTAISDAEQSKEKIVALEAMISALKTEKDQTSQLAQSAEARATDILKRIGLLEEEINKTKEAEVNALQAAENNQEKALQTEKALAETLNKKEDVERLLQNAQESERLSLQQSKDAQLQMQTAVENEQIALQIAEKARLEAEKARKNETMALELAKEAQKQKEIALQNEREAKKAEARALEIASAAQMETSETRLKIQTITQTADNAFNENISDKLIPFTVTVEYKNRPKPVNKKVITMQGIPVKINDNYLIFVLLDQIGLDSSLTPDQYITYNITANDLPVTKLYVKAGQTKIAALAINPDVKYCLPLGRTNKFSSYMPILFSIRSQEELGIMDRIRNINNNFFTFKRDYLQMISMDELYYNNEGIRGTGDYAEYIVRGDQIVDLGGNFIGLAYKKNTILRIDQLDGWHEIQMNKISAQKLAKRVRDMTNS